ncbi:MAG: hypothetical protein JJ913_14810 [Rhizobiaceae bacterium]|nr:hypothetical protein [Rhizobiaceae bacterium]
MSFIAKLIVPLLCLVLASCQAGTTEDVLGGLANQPPAPAQETLGTGPVPVTLLVARNAGDPARRNVAHDVYHGAALALRELGANQLSISVLEASGGPDTVRALAAQAAASGSKLILSAQDGSATSALATISPVPPVIDLTGTRSAGKSVFAFASDEVASALEGVAAAVAAKQTRVVVAVPAGMPADAVERLRKGVRGHGATLTDIVAYPPAPAALAGALAARRTAFEKATTLVVFGEGDAPARVARAVATGGYGGAITTLIGNFSWRQQQFSDPVLDGALIAMIDQQSLKELGARFSAATGRPLSLEAAFAYDAVALAAGLVRARGNDAIVAGAFGPTAWYAGTTGEFRFDAERNVDRALVLYRVQGGQLVPLPGASN